MMRAALTPMSPYAVGVRLPRAFLSPDASAMLEVVIWGVMPVVLDPAADIDGKMRSGKLKLRALWSKI